MKIAIFFTYFICSIQRKQREDTIAIRAGLLEKDNASLRAQVCSYRNRMEPMYGKKYHLCMNHFYVRFQPWEKKEILYKLYWCFDVSSSNSSNNFNSNTRIIQTTICWVGNILNMNHINLDGFLYLQNEYDLLGKIIYNSMESLYSQGHVKKILFFFIFESFYLFWILLLSSHSLA